MKIKPAMITLSLLLCTQACVSVESYGPISPAQLQVNYPQFRARPSTADDQSRLQQAWNSHPQLHLKVFFGTWCHDSEREVPRLLGLLEGANIATSNVVLIAVDHNKQDPQHEVTRFAIKRTPTIVLLQADQEVGRITERPIVSIAQDLIEMMARAN